jgi:hypothetical protein
MLFAVPLIIIMSILHKSVISTVTNKNELILEKSRYILNKTAWEKPFSNYFATKIPATVAYNYNEKILSGILIAKSGDTVSMISGLLIVNSEKLPEYSFETEVTISTNFSPRDNLLSFEIPKIGDKIYYDKKDISSATFLYGLMKQVEEVEFGVKLLVGGTEKSDFFINDFALYRGMFKDIPENLKSSKHFWNAFLLWYEENVSSDAKLISEIRNSNDEVISGWKVRENYYFIIVPHRNGFDSRYTGPIAQSKIIGTFGPKLPF